MLLRTYNAALHSGRVTDYDSNYAAPLTQPLAYPAPYDLLAIRLQQPGLSGSMDARSWVDLRRDLLCSRSCSLGLFRGACSGELAHEPLVAASVVSSPAPL